MLADVFAVARKEWQEYLRLRGSTRSTLVGILIPLAVLGVYLPLQAGLEWVESPLSLAAWAWMPLIMASSVVADSFAGERERHTLETLLASRLTDRAILLGKILAAVSYAWILTLVLILLGLVTVNVNAHAGRLLLFAPTVWLAGAIVGLLVALLISGIGVLVSLRASTVRQAQQTLSFATLFVVFVPVVGRQVPSGGVATARVADVGENRPTRGLSRTGPCAGHRGCPGPRCRR